MNPKLRDALTQKLMEIHKKCVRAYYPTDSEYQLMATLLLESVPGEEELAAQIQSMIEDKPTQEWSPWAMRCAQLFRSHCLGWIE